MAAFSYQYHPFLVDSSFFFPNTPTTTKTSSSFEEQEHINTCPSPPQFPLHQEASSVVTNQDTISCVDQSSKVTISYTDPSPFVTQNHSPETSMVVDKLENGEQVTQNVITTPMDNKKRKTTNGSSLNNNSPQSKDSTEGRNKRQKKSNGGVEGEDKPKEEKKDKKKGPEEPPTGYIHVRARRGQATDSHSLAERVRREKISERMKMLQRLVPGCDKVTGKALVLDEIINYVQSLQNQVEFLSMKLASLSPLFLDLAMDMDTLLVRPDQKLNSIPPSSVPQCSPSLATTFADTTTMTTSFPASNDYLLDYSSPVFLQGQRSNVFSEYTGGQFWDGEDQRQKLLHHPYVDSQQAPQSVKKIEILMHETLKDQRLRLESESSIQHPNMSSSSVEGRGTNSWHLSMGLVPA